MLCAAADTSTSAWGQKFTKTLRGHGNGADGVLSQPACPKLQISPPVLKVQGLNFHPDKMHAPPCEQHMFRMKQRFPPNHTLSQAWSLLLTNIAPSSSENSAHTTTTTAKIGARQMGTQPLSGDTCMKDHTAIVRTMRWGCQTQAQQGVHKICTPKHN